MKLTIRIWVLIAFILLALLMIKPTFQTGVVVKSIEANSSVLAEGLSTGEIIKSINGETVENKQGYTRIIEGMFSSGERERVDIQTNKNLYTVFISEAPKISVSDVPRTRIQTGLDLRGGARALVKADQDLNEEQLDDLIAISRNRFNVFGLSDVNIKGVTDFDGNKFMLIEIAGATPNDLEKLIGEQGVFEAKVGNETVFVGGAGADKDISDVCRNDGKCADVRSCAYTGTNYACRFDFVVYLTQKAAEKHADITSEIPLDESGEYLTEKLYLYIDGNEVDTLLIGASLKGQVTTQILIQGSGEGATRQDAIDNARDEMKKLQTILLTGSLPYKLDIVKLDTISPLLGDEFVKNIFLAGIAAIVAVSLIVFIRYRRIKASLALLLTSFSEILIILGLAALIKWNLDLPSIAGILAVIGTGVDQQIVILDEATKGVHLTIADRIKRALFVILTAYATSFVALIPLWWAGAGLFKGFAFTSIIGITAGVLITRPAFADIIKKFEK